MTAPSMRFVGLGYEALPNKHTDCHRQWARRNEFLKYLGVQPGEKITVDKLPDGRIEVKTARPTGKIRMPSIS